VISEKYYPFSGAELVIHEVIKMLKHHGFKITVITGSGRIQGVNGVNYLYSPILNMSSKIELWTYYNIYRRYFDKWILSNDVVYIPRLSYPLIPQAKRLRRKIIVHVLDLQPIDYEAIVYHPYENYKHNILSRIQKSVSDELLEYQSVRRAVVSGLVTPFNGLCAQWLSKADVVICECKRIAHIIEREIPALIGKIKIISNPLPNVPFMSKELNTGKSFLYGGGTLYGKGITTLVEASLSMYKKYPSLKLILARINNARWKSLLSKLNSLFVIYGNLKYREFLELHRAASALIVPTLIEEFPMIVLESMLAGTIPIASKTGGIPEMVQGTFAEKLLFTPGSVNELTDRMEQILTLSPEQLADIGMQLRAEVMKKYDKKVITDKLVRVFEV